MEIQGLVFSCVGGLLELELSIDLCLSLDYASNEGGDDVYVEQQKEIEVRDWSMLFGSFCKLS